ncbi:Pentatricopeptide repeat-containing protein [Apostasia shenzhenica]|uniref:Pentatricopeptide repeat-containing protein n=1 Tax=Apostasia shenzhenica TaxID=1088818 RepID=A0A2H9ZWD5_9ASPA|nr:Pentatricopeptide repeat-containing protein [Apostasia shenzhenica]
MSHPPPIWSLAGRLSRALIFASKPSQEWSPVLEETVRRFLRSSSSPLTAALVSSVIDPHLLRHHALAAGLFHFASQQPNFSHSPLSFHSLFKSLATSRHHSIFSLLKLAQAQRVPLFPSSISLAASSLLRSGRALDAAGLLKHANCEFPPSLCNALLAAVSASGSFGVARRVFDEMLKKGVQFNTLGFGCFMGKFSRAEELEKTLDVLEKVKQREGCRVDGSIIALMIVDGLCRASRIDDAWRMLEELRERDCKPDFISYRVVSESFRSVGRLEEMEKILKQKRKLGVAPRANDYREFILTLISEKRISAAKELAEAIVDGDFPIEDDVLNALIGSTANVDADSAVLFCKYMIKNERFPSLVVLRHMSRKLCKDGKVDEMWEIFRVIIDKGFFKVLEEYNVVVSFLCKLGRVREAYGVLKEMKKKGFKADTSSYNILMEALCREGLLRPAKKLWDEMFQIGCCSNLQTYNILIKKLSEVGEAKEVQKLFNHLLEKGIIPNDVTYSSVMKVLCQENRINDALEIFCKFLEHDTALAGSTLSTLVLSLCKEGSYVTASHVVRGVSSKIECCDSDFILVKSLADAGEVDVAAKHIEWLTINSPFKLQKILCELLETLSTTPKLDGILQLLQRLRSQDLFSGDATWTKLLEGCKSCVSKLI